MPLVLGSVFAPVMLRPWLYFSLMHFFAIKESGLRNEIGNIHRHLVNLSRIIH
jgi:hypothetical protein